MSRAPERLLGEQIASREAYLAYLKGAPEQALGMLAGKTDPESLARHLSILIQQGRAEEAAALVRGLEPDAKWCGLAAYAFARSGNFGAGEHVLAKTKDMDERLHQQKSAMCFAQGCLEFIAHRLGRKGPIPYSALNDDDRRIVRRMRAALDEAFTFTSIGSPLAEHAACLALNAYICLKDEEAVSRVASALVKRTPVPLPLADAVLAQVVPIPDGFLARLRSEHEGSFEAALKAVLIESMLSKRAGPALAAALALKDDAKSAEQRADLLRALYKIASVVGPSADDLVDSIAPDLLREGDSEFELFSVDHYLRRGDLDAAAALIEGAAGDDNPSWTQAAALLREKKGDVNGALDLLRQVPDTAASPGMLVHAAALAYQHDRPGAAILFLERLVQIAPGDEEARQNLALVYGQVGNFEKAAAHYSVLRDAHPDDPKYAVRLGASFALGAELEKSRTVYEAVCKLGSAPLEAHLGLARVLWALGRPADGLAALEAVRGRFWGKPAYMVALITAAHASGRDDLAAPVLHHFASTQKEGGPTFVQVKNIDEVKQFILQQRELQETLSGNLLRGRVPWLMADAQMHRVPYFGWAVRTLPAGWLPEEPSIRARDTVYATNAFTVVPHGGKPQMTIIECPDKGASVVADMTSLITLHALGLLDRLPGRFREVLVPATYFARALDDRANLLPHQLSRRTASALLKRALEDGRLRAHHWSEDAPPRPCVEEHSLSEGDVAPCYRLIDLGAPLHEAGRMSDQQFDRLRSMAHRPPAAGASLPPLDLGTEVVCQVSTLQALAGAGILGPVLDGFRVLVTDEGEAEIRGIESRFQFQEDVAARHTDLWERVGDASRFKRVPVEVPSDWKREVGGEPARDVSMAASMVALYLKVPLLADDRTCQVLALNREQGPANAAFGTGHLLSSMMADGSLDVAAGTGAFLQLMRWRYRFVLPPVEVLLDCAHQFRQHPPGGLLREVAFYAQDCMRDPGLLNGPEQTVPPMPMGVRLFDAWCDLAGALVSAVWADLRFSEEAASHLTWWAVEVLLPSPPANHPFHWQRVCAELTRKAALSGALVRSLHFAPSDRTRAGFRALGEALGLSDEEYRMAITEIIDGF